MTAASSTESSLTSSHRQETQQAQVQVRHTAV
jgi:hypothetical protein